MIQEEFLNDGTLIKHWSDVNVMLRQIETGAEYGEAIDIVPCPYTYEETDISIITEEEGNPMENLDMEIHEDDNTDEEKLD